MFSSKDFGTGCLAIIVIFLCFLLVPVLITLFKISLIVAIPVALFMALIIGIGVLGKVVNRIFTKRP